MSLPIWFHVLSKGCLLPGCLLRGVSAPGGSLLLVGSAPGGVGGTDI